MAAARSRACPTVERGLMDFNAIYHFLFESFAGIGVLVLAILLISILACVIMEWKTRRTFKDRGPAEDDDDFMFFDDDEDDK